jgi:hypothetical protein
MPHEETPKVARARPRELIGRAEKRERDSPTPPAAAMGISPSRKTEM